MGIWNLVRIALFLLLAWMLYRGIKSFFIARGAKPGAQKSVDPATGQEIEMMVQDPQCSTYLPQKDAVWIHHRGQDLFFCSETCRDEYLAEHKKK